VSLPFAGQAGPPGTPSNGQPPRISEQASDPVRESKLAGTGRPVPLPHRAGLAGLPDSAAESTIAGTVQMSKYQ